jgi:hypothetical protein
MGVAAEKLLAATLQEGPGAEAVGRVEGLKDRAGRASKRYETPSSRPGASRE